MSHTDRYPATLADALTRPGPAVSVRGDYAGDATHIWWLPDGRIITQGLGAVPPKSRFQAGDQVRLHGYPGARQRHGFVGIVLGSRGKDLLEGITDDGRTWVESRGWLDPADQSRDGGAASCTCCPHPEMFAPRPVRVEQLDLFDELLVGAS